MGRRAETNGAARDTTVRTKLAGRGRIVGTEMDSEVPDALRGSLALQLVEELMKELARRRVLNGDEIDAIFTRPIEAAEGDEAISRLLYDQRKVLFSIAEIGTGTWPETEERDR